MYLRVRPDLSQNRGWEWTGVQTVAEKGGRDEARTGDSKEITSRSRVPIREDLVDGEECTVWME